MRLLFRTYSLILAFGFPLRSLAQVTFFGPTPYLSAEDSPFDMSGLGTTFFFEDFEDGIFDLPPGVDGGPYAINGPGAFTDSVDGDDGTIDGSGSQGHSLKPLFVYSNLTNPPTWYNVLVINFDRQTLGYLPNALGFVWTDGLATSELRIIVSDQALATIGTASFSPLMDESYMGESAEDSFVALMSDQGFRQVVIANFYRGNRTDFHFELDHIQFGLQVPEPVPGLFTFACLWALGNLRSIYHCHDRQSHRRSRHEIIPTKHFRFWTPPTLTEP